MDTAQTLVAILGSAGGGAVLVALVNGLIKWISGASARERNRNTDLITQRRKAIEERDAAELDRDASDLKKRQAYEYASRLRRQLIENGYDPEEWPLDRTVPAKQVQKKEKNVAREPWTGPLGSS